MIQANELRIYNWVYNSTTKENMLVYPMMIAQLSRLEKDGGHSVNIHPIPLTEEILLKCGFKIRKDGKLYHDTLSLYEADFIFNIKSGIIKNLHQLQNLYFALTGQELEVNLC